MNATRRYYIKTKNIKYKEPKANKNDIELSFETGMRDSKGIIITKKRAMKAIDKILKYFKNNETF